MAKLRVASHGYETLEQTMGLTSGSSLMHESRFACHKEDENDADADADADRLALQRLYLSFSLFAFRAPGSTRIFFSISSSFLPS